ncbi:MAG TPA: stage II sporulation protein E [Clostridia bacterium]|nr:stage II sporulation protein E [Clostridia bacterium]
MLNDTHAYTHNQNYSIGRKDKWGLSRSWITGKQFVVETICLLAAAFLLSRAAVFGELLPFGTAFFVAAAGYRKNLNWPLALFISLGLLTAVDGYMLWQSVAVILMCAVILQGVNVRGHFRTPFLPGVAFVCTGVVKGAFAAVWSATMYTFMAVGFECLLAAGFTYAFVIVLQSLTRMKVEGTGLTVEEAACYVVLGAGVISGINDVYFGPLSLAGIVSTYVIISAAHIGGCGMGAGIGAVVGIIPSLTAAAVPNAVGIYAFSGLCAGVFRHIGKFGALGGFIIGHLIFSVYFLGETSLSIALGEVLFAGVIFVLHPENWFDRLRYLMPFTKRTGLEQDSKEVLKKVKELGFVFHELARTFEQTGLGLESDDLADQEDRGIDSLDLMLNTISANVCGECSMFRTCWENDIYNTYQNILALFVKIEETGKITDKDIRGVLGRRCRRTVEMAATINCVWDICQVNCFWQKKLTESKDLVSSQLHGVGEIISKLVKQTEIKDRTEEEIERKLVEVLELNGIRIRDVSVFKRNHSYHCHLVKKPCRGFKDCTEKTAPIIEDVLGVRMSIGHFECAMESGVKACEISFVPRRLLDIDLGIAQCIKTGNGVSGDSFASVFLHSRTALVLSDGMGSGSRAARESMATVNLLKSLLECGFDRELAVKTVNAALALRSPEDTFSTVDLAVIDLFSGKADFVKIAAQPSFIKKGKNIHTVNSGSLPIGILDTVDYEPVTMDLENGDLLVMTTDGLLDAGRRSQFGEDWVIRELHKFSQEDPQRIADHLVSRAEEMSGGTVKDDIMVVVARIVPYCLH